MREIFCSVSGVKIVPSFTTTAIATRDDVPNTPENLSWALMKGCFG